MEVLIWIRMDVETNGKDEDEDEDERETKRTSQRSNWSKIAGRFDWFGRSQVLNRCDVLPMDRSTWT